MWALALLWGEEKKKGECMVKITTGGRVGISSLDKGWENGKEKCHIKRGRKTDRHYSRIWNIVPGTSAHRKNTLSVKEIDISTGEERDLSSLFSWGNGYLVENKKGLRGGGPSKKKGEPQKEKGGQREKGILFHRFKKIIIEEGETTKRLRGNKKEKQKEASA